MALVLQSRNDTWVVGSSAAGMIAKQVRCLNCGVQRKCALHGGAICHSCRPR
jgi:hypothetical protein